MFKRNLKLQKPKFKMDLYIHGDGIVPIDEIEGIGASYEIEKSYDKNNNITEKKIGFEDAHNIILRRKWSEDAFLYKWYESIRKKKIVDVTRNLEVRFFKNNKVNYFFQFVEALPVAYRLSKITLKSSEAFVEELEISMKFLIFKKV